jgi:nucleoside-diphosphate-sugar epimerase
MNVLVTGHHGYIGSVLAPYLRQLGHDVTGLDTFHYRDCDFGYTAVFEPALVRDVRDVWPGDLRGFDAVVHLAALSTDPLGDLDPELSYAINRDGTIALAQAAREAGVRRFVFASSCSMYGAAVGEKALTEEAPLLPLTAHADSKVQAEEALWELADDDFAPVAMRNATVYGVSPRLRLDLVLNNLAAWAYTTGAIRLQSEGSCWRPLVHVSDVARATQALLAAPEGLVRGEAFNIGSAAQNYLIRDLAEMLHERLPHSEVTFAEGAPPDPRSYRVDFSKFESAFPDCRLEWTPERGIDELLRVYELLDLTLDEFEGHRYTRLRQLKRLVDRHALDDDLRWAFAPQVSLESLRRVKSITQFVSQV